MEKKVVFIIVVIGLLNIVALILFALNVINLSLALIILVENIANIIVVIYHFSTVKLLMDKTIKDQFTQIYNKNYFEEILNQKVDYSNRSEENLSLIMFDIDDFKNVNDKYGHPMGDKVLLELTKTVSKHIRSYDIFSRIGGEEFTIIMSSTTYQEVTETAPAVIEAGAQVLVSGSAIFGKKDYFKAIESLKSST